MTVRLLLAEDRATLRQALAETLKRAGFDVAEAADGRLAMNSSSRAGTTWPSLT